MRWDRTIFRMAGALLLCGIIAPGCDDMRDGSRSKPLEASTFFEDGKLSRPRVEGTVPIDPIPAKFTNFRDEQGNYIDQLPFELTRGVLERGRQRYEIYCGVCHGDLGDGNGMIVQRGFTRPPSLHDQRLRDAPLGHFVNVISNGWGAMYSYNDRVGPEDRWKIAAYIRALQFSQNPDRGMLEQQDLSAMQSAAAPARRPAMTQNTQPATTQAATNPAAMQPQQQTGR